MAGVDAPPVYEPADHVINLVALAVEGKAPCGFFEGYSQQRRAWPMGEGLSRHCGPYLRDCQDLRVWTGG